MLNHALKNWRTTAMGLGSIVTALGDVLSQLGAGRLNGDHLAADLTGIFVGLGLIFARDAAVSEHEHARDREEIRDVKEEVRAN